MLIGVPKEVKNHEYRVALTPASVRESTHTGHRVIVETNAEQADSTIITTCSRCNSCPFCSGMHLRKQR